MDIDREAEQIIAAESAGACGEAVARYWQGLAVASDMPDNLRDELTVGFNNHYLSYCWPADVDDDE